MLNINNSLRAIRLNSYAGTTRPTVKAIVLHDTAGSGTVGDAKYLASDPEGRHVSVDFVVLRSGEIYKLNPDLTRYSTNHAGRHTHLRTLEGADILNNGAQILNANVNAHTIGIEISHSAVPAKQFPEWPYEQVTAVGALCKDLCDKFNLQKEAITTHKAIITDGSRSDPRNFPWALFWEGFSGDSNPDEPSTPLTPGTYHVVVEGDTLWGLANTYHTSIEAIKALNHFDSPSTLITVGQRLLVKE